MCRCGCEGMLVFRGSSGMLDAEKKMPLLWSIALWCVHTAHEQGALERKTLLDFRLHSADP